MQHVASIVNWRLAVIMVRRGCAVKLPITSSLDITDIALFLLDIVTPIYAHRLS